MAKFINPFTDVGFKKIFGQEVSKDLLIDFLNDLLVDEKSITDITFLDKEVLPEYMGNSIVTRLSRYTLILSSYFIRSSLEREAISTIFSSFSI